MNDNHLFQGYASVWNAVHARDETAGTRLCVLPGALLFSDLIDLHAGHDPSVAYSSTGDQSLELAFDDYGVRCAFSPRAKHGGLGLVRDLCRRAYSGLSLSFYIEDSRIEERDGETIEIVHSATIEELSVVTDPRCPGAACWLADVDTDDLPKELRPLARRWRAGGSPPSTRSAPATRNRSSGLTRARFPRADRVDTSSRAPTSVYRVLALAGRD